MDTWIDIRRKARACHHEARNECNGKWTGRSLVDAALKIHKLETDYFTPGQGVGKNVLGFLDRSARLINVARNQDSRDEVVVIGHELGHFILHSDPTNEVTAISI